MPNKSLSIITLLTLFAPLPEGYAVYMSIINKLFWPPWVAAPSAFIVSMIGFFAIQIAERMNNYNHTLRLDEKTAKMEAPFRQALIALAVWFVGSLCLILFLDTAFVAVLAPVALVVIGASGSFIRGLGVAQDERERFRTEYRARVARKRTETRTANVVRASAPKSVRTAKKYPRKCAHCNVMLANPNAVGGHMKKNHPEQCKGALANNLFQTKVEAQEKP